MNLTFCYRLASIAETGIYFLFAIINNFYILFICVCLMSFCIITTLIVEAGTYAKTACFNCKSFYLHMELLNIPWLPDRYRMDSKWNIISLIKMRPYQNKDWYMTIQIWRKNYLVHRLIWKTLIYNPKNKPFINHINWIKSDNRLEKLEWVTASENCIHAYQMWLSKSNVKRWVWWTNMKLRKKV